jgi:uncharacterized RDD family membrane protein YckC
MRCLNHRDAYTGLNRCRGCSNYFCSICMQPGGLCGSCGANAPAQAAYAAPNPYSPPMAGGGGLAPPTDRPQALEPASRGLRWLGNIIDRLILYFVVIPLLGALFPGDQFFTRYFLAGLLYTAYEAILLTMRGQTVGKMICGTKVITPDDRPIDATAAWTRAIVRNVMDLFCVGLIDILFIFGQEKTCLHDRIAGTVVGKL